MDSSVFLFEIGLAFLVAVFATVLLIPLVRKLAVKLDAIDYPSARRVNMRPVARLGGVAMFGGICSGFFVVIIGVVYLGWPNPFIPHPDLEVNYLGVALGVLIIFIVGFIDDVKDLSPKVKLLGQIIAASVVAASGLLLSNIQNPFGSGFIEFGIWSYPITVFYLVAFANIINLIDGLDGLAGGITVISAATIMIFAYSNGVVDATFFCVILIAVCIGFLTRNIYPATIFMGDSGSLVLGLSLGIISLFAVARSALVLSLAVPILAAGVPIIDTFFAIIRRKRQHKRIDEADKGHIHHQLMRAGFSQAKTVAIMWGWTAILSICALLIFFLDPILRIPVIVFIVVLSGALIARLHLLGPVLAHHFHPRRRLERTVKSASSSKQDQ